MGHQSTTGDCSGLDPAWRLPCPKSLTAVDWILRTGDCPVRKLETALGSGQCVVIAVSRVNIRRLLCPRRKEKPIDKLASDPEDHLATIVKINSLLLTKKTSGQQLSIGDCPGPSRCVVTAVVGSSLINWRLPCSRNW